MSCAPESPGACRAVKVTFFAAIIAALAGVEEPTPHSTTSRDGKCDLWLTIKLDVFIVIHVLRVGDL